MAEQKSYFDVKENWPMALLAGMVVAGVLIWWNQKQKLQEDGTSSIPFEAVPVEEASPSTEFPSAAQTETLPPSAAIDASLKTATTQAAIPPAQNLSSSPKLLTIQVHSFQNQAKAQRALDEIQKSGFAGFLMKRDLKEKGIWYRVCVGEFPTRKDAETELAKVKAKYKDSFLINR